MIKVKNNVPVREPIPEFLQGLDESSLKDLSWTDPSLGVYDSIWLPEEDQSLPLKEFEIYGNETLVLDIERQVVISVKEVIPMPQDQVVIIKNRYINQIKAQRAEAYRTESDPLFFKAQRGEATQQEWLDKVAEIQARYPKE